jgi:hypothetical protein
MSSDNHPAQPPTGVGLVGLREAAAGCRACELWEPATQTVFGEGPETARIVFVGEQPGDQEDRTGEPFVGPAGRLLDKALADAGIDRRDAYITNAVKHFLPRDVCPRCGLTSPRLEARRYTAYLVPSGSAWHLSTWAAHSRTRWAGVGGSLPHRPASSASWPSAPSPARRTAGTTSRSAGPVNAARAPVAAAIKISAGGGPPRRRRGTC